MRYSVFLAVMFLIFSGCSEFKDSLVGNLGKACFGDGTCKNDLVCVDNVCVEKTEDTDTANDEDFLDEPDETSGTDEDQDKQDSENIDTSVDESADESIDDEIVPDDENDDDNTVYDHDAPDDDGNENDIDETAENDEDESEVPDNDVNCGTASFDNGAGTEGDPFIVATPEDLNKVRCFPSSYYFRQMAEIDLSGYQYGEGWVPIGDTAVKFSGTYDGNGYKITNLFINRPDKSKQGLFGHVLNGSLNNIKIENIDVTGDGETGSLAGMIEGTTVINCSGSYGIESALINVRGGSSVGGLIGYNYEGSVIGKSYSQLNIEGDESVGGLTGMSYQADIDRSYATGSVTGNKFVGGLVGYLMGTSTEKAKIENCYSRGDVVRASGTNANTGSFAGIVFYGEINYCYSTGSVKFPGYTDPVDKGFAGGASGTNTFNANFFDTETTAQTSGTTATGLTTAQMKSSAFFTGEGWDFTTIWDSDGSTNDGYMYLK